MPLNGEQFRDISPLDRVIRRFMRSHPTISAAVQVRQGVDGLSELKRKPGWFWAVIVLGAVFMICAMVASDPFRLILWAATIATFSFVYVATNRHEKHVAQLQAVADVQRLPQLTRDLMMNGATLSVHASSFLWAGLLVSAITISKAGVQTPSHGLIPWQEIEGIYLASVTVKGETQGHRLNLFVPELQSHLDRMHPIARAFHTAMLRIKPLRIVAIRLFSPSESATLIESLCREIWKATIGRDRIWSPDMPPVLMNAGARTEALLRELDAADKAGDQAKFIALASSLEQEQKLVQRELKKTARSSKWISVLMVIVVTLLVIARLWPIVSEQLSK